MEDLKINVKPLQGRSGFVKKVLGVICIILGFLALITPFTPGSWLIFVGLELLGLHIVAWDKFKEKFLK